MTITEKGCFTEIKILLDTYRIQAETEGKSPKTLNIYTTALTVLCDFLKHQGYSTEVTKITSIELRDFIYYLQNTKAFMSHPFTGPQQKGLAGHTINCYLRAVRAFWSWLVAEEIILDNPFRKIKIPKPPKKIITPFSEDQIRSLLAAIDTSAGNSFRDWCIILTLLDTGMRISELLNLSLPDVRLEQRSFKICGKGNKERIVPIGISVQRAIAKYIMKYRPKPAYPLYDTLFLSREGIPLTINRIEFIIERYADKAGIEGVRASPHTFRHTFAISYLRNGGDIFTLQQILGHESLDMVRNYINLAQHDLQASHLRYSPADRLKIKSNSYSK